MKPTPKFSAEVEARMVHLDVSDDRFRLARVTINEAVRKRAVAAVDDATYALSEAAQAFGLLHRCLSLGYFRADDPLLIGTAALCQKALRMHFERDCDTLESLLDALKEGAELMPEGEASK